MKKPNQDLDELKNYRPVSNLAFLGKRFEKVVASNIVLLIEYLDSNRKNTSLQIGVTIVLRLVYCVYKMIHRHLGF